MRTIATGLAMALLASTAGCGDATSGQERDAVAVAMPTASTAVMPPPPLAGPTLPVPTDTTVTDGWLGRWVGVEGLVLTIARGDRPATYRLHVALMDGAADYLGTARGDSIRFERNGRTETIRHASGEGTGLKWLADKTNCLVIIPGEGFCRD